VVCSALFLFLIICDARSAAAASSRWWIPFGISYADSSGPGSMCGAELSAVNLGEFFGCGVYGDAQKILSDGFRVSAGPELMLCTAGITRFPLFLGVDGGYAFMKNNGKNQSGYCVRAFVGLTILIPYVRFNQFGNRRMTEYGLMMKVPLDLLFL
jgi:hypothetical protein